MITGDIINAINQNDYPEVVTAITTLEQIVM
jgi:hypothetical protein